MTKRAFIKTMTGAPLLSANMDTLLAGLGNASATETARDEAFWATIRQAYRIKPDYINLENGYYCIQPEPVLNAFVQHVRDMNLEGSYYLRTRQYDDKAALRDRLARLAGCPPNELIITRNTTESIDTVVAGMTWKTGDEAIMATHDYGAMLDMFQLQARRYGIVNKVLSIPLHPTSDEAIVDLYEQAITPRTRLLMVCHMVNITGQILPVRKIADMAHRHGVDVLVDGAHAFAQLDFAIPDLGCDYYATSLHKWLSVPIGAGLLYVKKAKIASLWPLFADSSFADDDIRKLNHTGTHPVHTDLTIADAIDFHEKIGIKRKEARLRYLQEYWTKQVRNLPGIHLNTPAESARACAIANVGVAGMTPAALAKTLLDRFKIWTVAIDGVTVKGVRITPNLYTSTTELDVLVSALKTLAKG
ncbi:aminotransferase class V-fold PLP-dependent enzyme [Fibrella aquatilis]|uniref:Aminotransferase class V-fold PLP-dependent enzyme n=1 Tax=Fibrella aquatilis TaxID=2817059 RepID=A0A939G232_9BACT|nr:aminotransferase class V-fold PLP-dependent enzyme [Fibrella aquatilis]MBO0930912.1 aminotransferase class V-fold PLP-dependent enzyme [Fibrella aquatilis]